MTVPGDEREQRTILVCPCGEIVNFEMVERCPGCGEETEPFVPASRLAEAEAQAVEARVDLMEALEREGALRHDLERAREALAFYAEESNYDYDETAVAYASNKGDVLADNGERARAALAALPVVDRTEDRDD